MTKHKLLLYQRQSTQPSIPQGT